VLLSDGTVLAIGGGVPQLGGEAVIDPHSVAAVERFDPATQQWTPAASLPFPRSQHHAVVLDDGQVLVVGGNDQAIGDAGYPSVVRYDPVSDTWTPAAPMRTPRYDFSIVKLGDGRVLVVGGVTETPWAISDDTGFRITASTEVYTP
jgi:N-acetylneuraminic acid mutarotase